MAVRSGGTSGNTPAAHVGRALILFLLLSQAFAFLLWRAAQLFSVTSFFLSLFSLLRVLVVFGAVLLFFHRSVPRGHALFPLPKSRIAPLRLLPFFLVFSLLLNIGATRLYALLSRFLGWIPPASGSLSEGLPALFITFFGSCLLTPLAEELLFRGCLQPALQTYGSGTAILVTSLAFSLLHANWWEIPVILPLSLALGLVAGMGASPLPCIVLHMGNNLMAFAFSVPGERDIVPLPLFAGILLACCLVSAFHLPKKQTFPPLPSFRHLCSFSHWRFLFSASHFSVAAFAVVLYFLLQFLGT